MSKQKTLLFNSLISILGVITLLLTFQFANSNRLLAANNTTINFDNWVMNEQEGNKTNTIYLYDPVTHKLSDFFDTNSGKDCIDAYNGENTYYWRKNSASSVLNNTGYMTHNFSLSQNLLTAIKNGCLELSVVAEFCSENTGSSGDRVDTVTMTLFGDGNVISTKSNKQENYEKVEFKTSNVYGSYSIKFEVKADIPTLVSWSKTIMKVKEPTIKFITNDITAPTIGQMNVENENIFTQSKMVTFDITDEQSGIDKVLINGVEASSVRYVDSNTKKQGTVSIVVNENDKDYKIEVFDNVGNIQTYTYHSSNIDITAPSLTLDFDDNTIFENMRVRFNVTIDTTYTQAEESYFYTFDGSDPKTSSTRITLVNGLNSFEVPAENSYVLKVYACDSAGNETVIERNFSVALKYYNYTINATLNGNNAQNIEISSGQQVLSDTDITCSTADIIKDGVTYKFYKAFINGQESVINNDTFVLKQDTTVDLVYREFVNFEFTKQNYDATGEVLEIEYLANCPKDLVILDITKDGKESAFSTAGTYLVKYSIDNENFVGGGEIELNILNPLTITINSTEYVYNENGFTFDYILSKNSVANELVFINEQGETISKEEAQENSLDAGEYQYKFTVLDENYYIVGTTFGNRILSGVFSIQNKNIDLPIYSQTIEYNAQDFVRISLVILCVQCMLSCRGNLCNNYQQDYPCFFRNHK